MRPSFSQRIFLLIALMIASLALTSCGGNPPTPMPTPPTSGQNGGGGYGAIGGSLDAPSPGTPLYQVGNIQEVYQAMATNLTGYKSATVTSQSSGTYAIERTYQGVRFYPVQPSGAQQISNPALTYQGFMNGYGGPNVQINLSSAYGGGGGYFQFAESVNIAGLILYSTDQMALFQSGNGEILKVGFRSPTPTISRYRIADQPNTGFQDMGGYPSMQNPYGRGYSSVPQVVVFQQNIQTNNQYQNQYQGGGYYPSGYQQQPGYGYQQPGYGYQQQPGYGGGGGYQQPGGGGFQSYPPGTF